MKTVESGKWKVEGGKRYAKNGALFCISGAFSSHLSKAAWKAFRAGLVFLTLSIFNFQFSTASAQNKPLVTASFDRDSIVIGDQFHLDVRVEKDMMQVIDFPYLLGTEIAPEIEVLGEFPADTLSQDGRRQTIGKRYLLTIFREGDYNIGRFPVLYADKNLVDTLYSADSLRVRVATFDINLETDQPFDIKPPRGIPLKFGEIGGWFALSMAVLAIIAAVIWLFVKYRKRIPFLGGEKPQIPPHLLAIRRLEALHNQKLPQNNKHKLYYSAITDILREYIKGRFGIHALEMTTDEILAAADEPRKEGRIDKKRYTDLKDILQTADLVKFAKFVPGDEENEAAYYNAYYFVEETKQVDDDGKPEDADEDPLKTT